MKNINQQSYTRSQSLAFNHFLASRFVEDQSLNVVFRLKSAIVENATLINMNEQIATSIARHFRNSLHQNLFGNRYRRFRHEIALTVALHTEPYFHLHAHIAADTDIMKLKIRCFCETFAIKNRFMIPFPHVAETQSEVATEIYNARFGPDSVILF